MQEFLQANAKDLQAQYNMLKPADKLAFFEKLLKFAIPTQQQSRIDFERMSDEDLDSVINSLKQHVQ